MVNKFIEDEFEYFNDIKKIINKINYGIKMISM